MCPRFKTGAKEAARTVIDHISLQVNQSLLHRSSLLGHLPQGSGTARLTRCIGGLDYLVGILQYLAVVPLHLSQRTGRQTRRQVRAQIHWSRRAGPHDHGLTVLIDHPDSVLRIANIESQYRAD